MRSLLPLALAAAAIACVGCGGAREPAPPSEFSPSGDQTAEESAQDLATEDATEADADRDDSATPQPIPRVSVILYFPSAFGDLLVPEKREIFHTTEPGDRAKQILADLIAGPAGAGATRAVPDGTAIRQIYVTPDGVAWVDLTSRIRDGLGGGSADEMMTVYAIVDSIALNVPEIAKVGILVDGSPVDTLNGHIDLRRPLPARRDLVRGGGELSGKRPRPAGTNGAAPRTGYGTA